LLTGLGRERPVLLLQSRGIVRQQPRGFDVRRDVGKLVRHRLELADRLAKLLALVGVGDGLFIGTLGEADHLGGDADAACARVQAPVHTTRVSPGRRTFVEDLDGIFVAEALLADEVLERDLDVIEIDGARRGGADAELWAS
jgi:hypothetical protein